MQYKHLTPEPDKEVMKRAGYKAVNLSDPAERVEWVKDHGKIFDKIAPGTQNIITGGELELFTYPYITMKVKQAAERGGVINILGGPILLVKPYSEQSAKEYMSFYTGPGVGIDEYQKLGDSFFLVHEFKPALHAYRQSLNRLFKPIKQRVHVFMHMTHAQDELKDLEGAIISAKKAKLLAPFNPHALANYGNALLKAGYNEKALSHLEKAVKMAENIPIEHQNAAALSIMFTSLGEAYRETKRREEAKQAYGFALQFNPDDKTAQAGLEKITE